MAAFLGLSCKNRKLKIKQVDFAKQTDLFY